MTHTLIDHALARLAQMAEGNGLAKNAIELLEGDERICTINGQLRLEARVETKSQNFLGPLKNKGKEVQILPNFTELQKTVNERKSSIENSGDWFEEALRELRTSPGHGWGHDGSKIPLANNKTTYSANEPCPTCRTTGKVMCPQCHGRTTILCIYCKGQGQEECYNCFLKGEDPVNPGQPCPICRGTKYAPCRYCKSTGQLPCPSCQSRGGTPCPTCQGMGSASQLVELETVVDMRFTVTPDPTLPSGLLRGLDRIGMVNLEKGHGDIELIEPDPNADKSERTKLSLRASIPFADVKLKLAEKTVKASIFGKKRLLMGIPPFLDDSLRLWRDQLVSAAQGHSPLENALKARVIKDALHAHLEGRHNPAELRKQYPVGLSPTTAKEIMTNVDVALRRLTLRTRALVAAIGLTISAIVFTGVMLSPLHQWLATSMSAKALLFLEALLPVGLMGANAYALAHAVRWILLKRFPQTAVRLSHNIGKLGYGTMAAILVLFAVTFALMQRGISFPL